MPVQVRKGGVWQQIKAGQVFANGAWRSLAAIKVYYNGVWRTVGNFSTPASPPPGSSGGGTGGGGTITVSASPTSQSVDSTNSTITSGAITATPSGGTAPYSYQCSIVSSDSGPTYTVDNPNLASTTVTAANVGVAGSSKSCTLQFVVTDSLGVKATSNSVTITFIRDATGSGGTL